MSGAAELYSAGVIGVGTAFACEDIRNESRCPPMASPVASMQELKMIVFDRRAINVLHGKVAILRRGSIRYK